MFIDGINTIFLNYCVHRTISLTLTTFYACSLVNFDIRMIRQKATKEPTEIEESTHWTKEIAETSTTLGEQTKDENVEDHGQQ